MNRQKKKNYVILVLMLILKYGIIMVQKIYYLFVLLIKNVYSIKMDQIVIIIQLKISINKDDINIIFFYGQNKLFFI